MVEHPGDMFQFPTVYFQGGIVKYDAGVPALCPDAVSPKKALKTEDGMTKQSAPVHRLPDHHAIIAVLAGGGKMMEVLLVHGVYCLTVNTKKTEGKEVVKSEQSHPLGDGKNRSPEAKNDRNRAEFS